MQLPNRIVTALVILLAGAFPLRADINSPVLPPPQAEAAATRVLRGGQVTVELRGHYGGSSFVRFWIVRPPAHGNLSQLHTLGDNRATILYSNNGDQAAKTDSFTFIIQAGGRVSAAAEVRVTIDEPAGRLRVPERIDFHEIMAGEAEAKPLTISNDGGGVLEGHLTVSSPWVLAVPDYRVGAGETTTIPVAFRPNEARTFVGQVTLTGTDGSEMKVPLAGAARAPIKIAPDPLKLAVPEKPTAPRRAIVFLTNRTKEPFQLEFRVGPNFEPIEPINLPGKEDKDVTIAVRAEVTGSVHEKIIIAGPGFTVPLQVDAEAPPPEPTATIAATRASVAAPEVTPAVQPTVAPGATVAARVPPPRPSVAPAAPGSAEPHPFVNVSVRRLSASRWQLQWPQPKEAGATYRIEERLLAIDAADRMQVSWRPLAPRKIETANGRSIAEIVGLKPRELHMLRVTALNSDETVLWESNLVPLAPAPKASHIRVYLLILFGGGLIFALFLRWRA